MYKENKLHGWYYAWKTFRDTNVTRADKTDPALSGLVMLVSGNVFHVVSALQSIVFKDFGMRAAQAHPIFLPGSTPSKVGQLIHWMFLMKNLMKIDGISKKGPKEALSENVLLTSEKVSPTSGGGSVVDCRLKSILIMSWNCSSVGPS